MIHVDLDAELQKEKQKPPKILIRSFVFSKSVKSLTATGFLYLYILLLYWIPQLLNAIFTQKNQQGLYES